MSRFWLPVVNARASRPSYFTSPLLDIECLNWCSVIDRFDLLLCCVSRKRNDSIKQQPQSMKRNPPSTPVLRASQFDIHEQNNQQATAGLTDAFRPVVNESVFEPPEAAASEPGKFMP
ncbi:hypothetical protein [Burkholderia multivorans]|uniref:hypothetical protein n=1 Tax=Burkholderia multivorans TaxID=87883 RepID=UPI001C226EAC|nr:hypothetical protein [Burkholderia multivorans]MBU9491247.1 hypothetical protein [Burkholderia multivorans]